MRYKIIEKIPGSLWCNDIYAQITFYTDSWSYEIEAGSIAGTDQGLEYAKNYTVYTKVYGATVFPNSAELIISGNRNGCNNWIKEAGKPTMIEQGSI